MIVRQRPRFYELIFLMKGSILGKIAPLLIFIFAFSCLAVPVQEHLVPLGIPALSVFLDSFRNAPVTLLGIAISIFLGFRNNACYDRWWEARRQLGQMVGEMRSLARLAADNLSRPAAALRPAIAFSLTLTAQLRRKALPGELAAYLTPEDLAAAAASRSAATYLLATVAREIAAEHRTGHIGEIVYARFDERLSAIANIQVACERINSTPTPFTYTLLLHRTAYLFCLPLPIALAPTLGLATPLFCTLVAYTFFGLDALGDQLEDPFGKHANSLPLDALTRITEIDLLAALHEANLPPYLEPVDFELS